MKKLLKKFNCSVLMILMIFIFVSIKDKSFATDRDLEILKVSPFIFRLNLPTPGIMSSTLSAAGELCVEINTPTAWKLKWRVLSEKHTISSIFGNEISGKGRQQRKIPFKWEFDWTMPPGIYELPLNITLIDGDNLVSKNTSLKFNLPFVANITPIYASKVLHITDDNFLDRQVTLKIQANAAWYLQVLMTQSDKTLELLCKNLHNSSSVSFLSSTPVLIQPDHLTILAQGGKGGEHRLTLDWQKSASFPFQAGDYNFDLYFYLHPARGNHF